MSDYTLIFDGGSQGNPGPGYGSYALIREHDGRQRIERLDFEKDMTNNEAEYQALITGLADLIETIRCAGRSPSEFSVEVKGDSQLILNQVEGVWKITEPHLMPLGDRVRELVDQFGSATLTWQERSESENLLGH